jgi:secretion/DNA translocation related TadE-like protein
MAGTVVMTGVIGCVAMLALGLAAAGGADVASRRAATSADAAALAAADTVSGLVVTFDGGADPCVRAEEVAAASGSHLAECSIDGLIATVSVTVPFGVLRASGRARAGPPGSP